MRIPLDSEEFDRKLLEIIDRSPASHLISIPGIYEILSEAYNNQVISELWSDGRWDDRQA